MQPAYYSVWKYLSWINELKKGLSEFFWAFFWLWFNLSTKIDWECVCPKYAYMELQYIQLWYLGKSFWAIVQLTNVSGAVFLQYTEACFRSAIWYVWCFKCKGHSWRIIAGNWSCYGWSICLYHILCICLLLNGKVFSRKLYYLLISLFSLSFHFSASIVPEYSWLCYERGIVSESCYSCWEVCSWFVMVGFSISLTVFGMSDFFSV